MLLNPKTDLRNILGNLFMLPIRKTKNIVASAFEKLLIKNPKDRNKKIFWGRDKELKQTVDDSVDSIVASIMSNSENKLESGISNAKTEKFLAVAMIIR